MRNICKVTLLKVATIGLLTSCSNPQTTTTPMNQAGHDSTMNMAMPAGNVIAQSEGITLRDAVQSQDFPNAKLELVSRTPAKDGLFLWKMNVTGYDLKAQTPDAHSIGCANSAQGQHIHHILNNDPYKAFYTDTFSRKLDPGTYVEVTFLSRSYHESIKHPGASLLRQFTVGKPSTKDTIDLKSPILVYSRPKDVYKGEDTKRILLDFYLFNVDLSQGGYTVDVKVNNKASFKLSAWKAYVLEGLPAGKNTITLSLVDPSGKVLTGKMKAVTREITLEP